MYSRVTNNFGVLIIIIPTISIGLRECYALIIIIIINGKWIAFI